MRNRRFIGMLALVGLISACQGAAPTAAPTTKPSAAPTAVPTVAATVAPTVAPTLAPTAPPTVAPTEVASPSPSPISFEGQTLKVAKSGDKSFDDATIGYWADQLKTKYGLTVQFDTTASPDVSLRAIVSGADEVAVTMSMTTVVSLVQQSGTDVKLIAADTAASDYQLLAQSSIPDVAGLAGKIEGISAPGDASELVSHICLNNLGFDYSKLQIVQIGNTSARVAALLAGQIDVGAAHISDALAAVTKSAGALKILEDCGKQVGQYPITGMIAGGAWLKTNPEKAQIVVDEYVNAMRWANASKAAYLAYAATWVPDANPAESATAYDYFTKVGFWPNNGGIDTALVETYLSYAAETGVLTGKIPTTDQWVDQSFVNTYLQANGTK